MPLTEEEQYALNQKRVDECSKKYRAMCKSLQEYTKDNSAGSCTCSKIQGNWNCKFNYF